MRFGLGSVVLPSILHIWLLGQGSAVLTIHKTDPLRERQVVGLHNPMLGDIGNVRKSFIDQLAQGFELLRNESP